MDAISLQKHIETEQKIIHLMLTNKSALDEIVDSGVSIDFFDKNHQKLVKFILKDFLSSNRSRLINRESFKKSLSKNDNLLHELNIFDMCLVGITSEIEDLGFLKNELLENYAGRQVNEALKKFNADAKTNGYQYAVKNLTDSLYSVSDTSLTNEITFSSLTDLKDEYFKIVKEEKLNPAEIIRCGVPEIDDAINVGFRPGHLTIFVADVGSHKCVTGDCLLHCGDGTRKTVQSVYDEYNADKKLPLLLSLNKEKKLFKQPIAGIYKNGIKKCYEVQTNMGFLTKTTDNHPFLTMNGYVELKNLKIGDWVGISRKLPFGNTQPSPDVVKWLAFMYTEGGTTQSSYRFTNSDPILVKEMKRACVRLGGNLHPVIVHGQIVKDNFRVTGLNYLARDYGLFGKKSIHKTLNESIFGWSHKNIALFLKYIYSCDGHVGKKMSKNAYKIVYSSSSKILADGVRDILLKFGIVPTVHYLKVKYKNEYKDAWQVVICDSEQIKLFIEKIGFIGKKNYKANKWIKQITKIKHNRNIDLIPCEVWNLLDQKFFDYKKSHYMCRRKLKNGGDQGRGNEGYCGVRGQSLNRAVLKKIAKYLKNDSELINISTSDIVWDKIKNISDIGEHETFDIAMPVEHNFVVDGFITHNTNVMLNVALNIAEKGHEVLFVPLEMQWRDLLNRTVCARTGITNLALARPQDMSDDDIKKIENHAMWNSNLKNFYILESKDNFSVKTMRREIEKRISFFKPKILFVDYADIFETDSHRGIERHLEINEMIKSLRALGRKYNFSIVTAAQMNRANIKALRESKGEIKIGSDALHGSHGYSAYANTIFALIKVPNEPNRLMIHTIKARDGASSQTSELSVDPSRCLISSSVNAKFLTSSMDLESVINTDPAEIEKFEPKEEVVFESIDWEL